LQGDVSEPLLSIDDVSVIRGDAVLLDRVSLSVAEGQHTAILGRNGSGKSTLVRLITRDIYPTGGGEGVRIFGQNRWDVFELRRQLGIVSPAVHAELTGADQLEVTDAVVSGFFAARGVWRHHRISDEMRRAATGALERMDVAHLVGRTLATLSTGEARRVLIARALVHEPRALLLDEPCAGLDPGTRRRFLETLRGLAASGTTLIMVTHHVEEILPEIERVVLLREGRVLAEGPAADLITNDTLTDLFGLTTTVTRRGDWYAAYLD
jgi:iron complex transport system ATP-binding protein